MDNSISPETRSRSRSKTPFLRSSCDSELCAHAGEEGHTHKHEKRKSPTKKNPLIQTIIEENVEQNERQKSVSPLPINSRINKADSTITNVHHQESETSRVQQSGSSKSTTVTTTTNISISSPKTGLISTEKSVVTEKTSSGEPEEEARRYSFRRRSQNQSDAAMNITKSKEVSQNEVNAAFELSKQQTSTPKSIILQQESLFTTNGTNTSHRDNNNIPYHQYIEAGEYWNKYPKTDFTYSRLSAHRRELAPGIVAVPNMSRYSLKRHEERVDQMVQQNPALESYIRQRYDSNDRSFRSKKTFYESKQNNHLCYDSQDETDLLDLKMSRKNQGYKQTTTYRESLITRIFTTIVMIFYRFTGVFAKSEEDNLYYTRIEEKRGFLGRIGSSLSSVIVGLFHYVYMFISSALYIDTLLLRSSNPDGRNKKRFLLFLLLLLPLLLLGVWCSLEDRERSALLLRTQNLVPLTSLVYRDLFSNSDWKKFFRLNFSSLNLSPLPLLSSSHPENNARTANTEDGRISLDAEQYERILNHIDTYIHKLLNDRLSEEKEKLTAATLETMNEKEKKFSNEISILIADNVHMKISEMTPSFIKKELEQQSREFVKAATPPESLPPKYELNDNDINKICEIIQNKLLLKFPNIAESNIEDHKKFKLTEENLEEISNLIQQKISINNENFNIIERLDINEVLLRILQSTQLEEFIDNKIMKSKSLIALLSDKESMINLQKNMIDELRNNIENLQNEMKDQMNVNNNIQNSLNALHVNQDELHLLLDKYKKDTATKFESILNEIDVRISKLNQDNFLKLNEQVKLTLVEILGYKTTNPNRKDEISEIDLRNWIQNTFVAKEYLEDQLSKIMLKLDDKVKIEIENSSPFLMNEINKRIKDEILSTTTIREKNILQRIEENEQKIQEQSSAGISGLNLTEEGIRQIVKDILSVYDADKTGLVDYALESAGGQVLSTRCTENYQHKSAQISIFGIPLWYPSNTPRIAISPAVQPGECWAFQGFPGFLVLKLSTMVFISGFTLEHIPKSLTPHGRIDSAPRNFTAWGLADENDQNPVLFGEYEYEEEKSPLQYFPVKNVNVKRPYDIVELRIETNHGNAAYTCLYRFRVHGTTAT